MNSSKQPQQQEEEQEAVGTTLPQKKKRSFKTKVRNTLIRSFSTGAFAANSNLDDDDDDDTLDISDAANGGSAGGVCVEIPVNVGAKAAPMAEERIAEILSKTKYIRHRNRLFDVPSFNRDAFEVGTLLARGGFANVHSLETWNCDCELNEDENYGKQYVIKSLRAESSARNPERLAMSAADLIIEAYILSALGSQHPNIITLRGMSTKGLSSLKRGRVDGLFLILDYLPVTLYNRLVQWQQKQTASAVDEDSTINDRLKTAIQLASALEFVHKKNIIYRDLKPSNVGFTKDGTVQLFDFGLAVEIPHSSDPNKVYKLAGRKGTARYMAPEVMKKKAYNAKADVFSFAILLWQLLALEKPYAKQNTTEATLNRILSGERPSLKRLEEELESTTTPSMLSPTSIVNLQQLLQKGWSKNLEERPTMKEFRIQLKPLLQLVKGEGNDTTTCNGTLDTSNDGASNSHSDGSGDC